LVGTLSLLSVNRGLAKTYTVSNETEFNALPNLSAGDIVQMQSGTYGSLNKNIISTITSDDVATSNPIKIYAVKPGGVLVNAPSYLLFSGKGIIFAGVNFGSGCGQLSTNGDIIRANYGSKYITFSHLRFTGCGSTNSSGDDVHWIGLSGFNNTIEYCSFNERPESSRNATVWIYPGISEGGIDIPRNHWIHHCYFGTRYAGTDNGFEAIRIGVGDIQTFDVRAVVEKNVFYRSIWRTDGTAAGEPEIISIKSKGNVVRGNTILESQGGICLRTGQYCTVEGNFIFGAGYYSGNSIATGTARTLQGGIRVIGKNQIVRNNYIFNVLGTEARSALCVMSGESNYDEGDPATGRPNSGSYLPADNAQIYNNTFINCAEINLGYLSPDSYAAPASPTGVKFYNNVWQGNGSANSALVRDTTSVTGYIPITLGGSGGNYIYETSSGKIGWRAPVGTYTTSSNPAITETSGNYKIPTSTSPLLGIADATLSAATDIRGFDRPTTGRDIGCYERDANGTTAYAPMLRNEVGAVFDGDGGPAVPSYYPSASLYESFESYAGTSFPAVAASPASNCMKFFAQVTPAVGTTAIGGTGGKVANFNDSTPSSAGLQFNVGSTGQTTLAVGFDVLSASSTYAGPMIFSLTGYNTGIATTGGSSAERLASIEFAQGSGLTSTFAIKNGGNSNTITFYTGTYTQATKQSFQVFANDHDTDPINYLGPDGIYRALPANSFSVFWNKNDGTGWVIITNTSNSQVYGALSQTSNEKPSTDPTITATLSSSGVVTAAAITSGGAGYTMGSSSNFTGIVPISIVRASSASVGSGGGGTATINNGIITAIAITSGGSGYTSNPTIRPLLLGNSTLGRAGFISSTGNNANFLIDNFSMSTMPTGVVIPVVTKPTFTSPNTASGQAGTAFTYIPTYTETAPTICSITGTLPSGLIFNSTSGAISGASNQSGSFAVTITATNSAGSDSITLTMTFTPAPPNIFSGSNPSLNTDTSWSLGYPPTVSTSGGSYTDLGFISSATSLTTTSGNINGKSYNVTNGLGYVFSSVRDSTGTIYKIGDTGSTNTSLFTNTITGVTNQLAYLANNSSITFSRLSPINNIPPVLQLRNSGSLRVETGSTLDIQTDVTQPSVTSGYGWTKIGGGTLKLSGSNSYTGASIVQDGTLALAGQGLSAVTIKTNAILEIALTSPGTATFSNTAAVSLEAGSKVRVTGTPAGGATYTLVSASSMTSLATLESSVSGYQLAVLNNTLQLQPVGAPTFSSSSFTATGAANSDFTYQIVASGSPTSYAIATGTLPDGLALNTATGAITGTPTEGGTFSVTISATNAGGTRSATLTLNFGDEFETLRLKWRDSLIGVGGTSNDPSALKYWTDVGTAINNAPSSSAFYLWSDLPLNTNSSGNMRDTFGRLETMALAYATPGSAYYGDATLATAVINGLNWMVDNVYNGTNKYDNWYHWMITGSQNFANTALLVYPALSQAQITSYYNKIQYYGPSGGQSGNSPWPDSYKWSLLTGANTAEAALVMTLNGILNKNGDKLAEAKTNLAKVFATVTNGDGFYSDGGYIFHGKAVENGSYGLTLIEAVSAATNLLYGTPWAVAEAAASEAYNNWIPKGLIPFYYRGAMMHMIRGRSYTTSGSTGAKAGQEGIALMRQVALFAPTSQKDNLTDFANSPHPEVGQYMFPSIDRVVAHRSNFSLGLSLSSSRTCNFDPMRNTPSTQNNDKGWNTADGMTSLYVGSTDSHFTGNIWPTMDWYHLTGTTAEQNYQAEPGTPSENWAGGAEVSGYGVAGMSLHPKDSSTASSTLYGKKSYFMLEKEVVCLGSGITAGSANEIHTTVENRRMGSSTTSLNLWVNGVATLRPLNWSTTLSSPKSCAIEGVGGYYFPDSPNNIRAEFIPSFGTWTGIHPYDSDTATYTDNYLRLIFNHGAGPSGATYAYTLLPAMTPSEVAGYAYNPQTTILSNTDTVQAVKNPTLGVVAANFWNSAGGTADLLTVNKSCSVIVRETYNSISVGLSDPSQTLTDPEGLITVTLNRTGTFSSEGSDPEVRVLQTTPTIRFTADVGGKKGKTIHATFSLDEAPQITSSVNLVALTGSPVSYQIASNTSGATYAVIGLLPPGLTLYESGLIYGTPTTSGTYTTTISATSSSGRVGYANLTTQVLGNLSDLSTTYGTSGTWVCPANVTAVQVECWGGGGAGGSACENGGTSAAAGGGGAGGAYAKVVSYPVTPGNTYYINVGAGGTNSSTNNGTKVSGGDSWFNSANSPSTTILAKGGGGGASAIGGGIWGSGGLPTAGSLGDVIYAGGAGIAPTSGRFGGGGGGSAGTNSAGSAPALSTNGVGASAVMGGGNGGNANPTASSSSNGQSPTIPPGGGGGGARDGGYVLPEVRSGGAGASGQAILTMRMKANSTIAILGRTFTYSGSPQGPGLESLTQTGSANSNLTYRYEGVAPTLYSASSTRPTDAGTYTVTAAVPEDSNFMAAVSSPAPFTIAQATTTYTQSPSARPITYGENLASSVLSGTASVAGAWSWANGAQIPTAGISVQTATFTPSDTKNYTTITANVSVTVNQGIPILSLPETGAITLTYGQALNFFNWSNWNSGSDGVLSWVDPNVTPGAGDSLQSVLFTPTDAVNYAAVSSSVTVRVNRADPVISQAPVASAIASGETLASSILSGGVANVPGTFAWTLSSAMPIDTENQSVTFTPTDSVNYNPVTVQVNVVVTEPFRQGSWVNLADDGRLLYKRDDLGNRIPDFTACGYKAGKEGIPYVPTRVVVKPGDGDDRALIQAAIDRVAAMTPDANGFRGAVLLTAGEYQISGPLLISTSGVVLRGVGESETKGTRLKSTDRSGVYNSIQPILLQIQGSGSSTETGTAQAITSPYVPSGSNSFEVASVSGFSVGSEVRVYRPCTTGWITAIGMDQLSPLEDGKDNRWKEGMRDLYWHRTIQRIEGNRIFLDAPITTAIDQTYGGGTVQKYTFAGRIEKCGVEDIRGLCSYDETKRDLAGNYIDEAHAWTFIEIESAQNCWVRRVTSRYFAYSCVSLMKGAKWVSVLNCQSLDPVSVVDGGRRYAFNIDDCELCLVKDCTNDSDRHQFVTHSNTSGPNAFVNGTSTRAFTECGPHHEWANGILWDRITVSGTGSTFAIRNRGNMGSGHGWAAANSLAWNCVAPEFDVENPPTARNWMIGCVGIRDTYNSAAVPPNPDFETDDSHGANVFPVSLLGRQRQDALGIPGSQIREYVVGDFDDCTPSGGTGDSASVDSSWLSTMTALSSSQIGTMDDTRTGKWIPWTHNFTLDSGDTILSATLWVGLRSTGTGWTDDVIYLDSPTQPVSLSSLGAALSGTSTSVVRLDLGPYLNALSDGKLNLALSGDTAVDWSMLELRVVSSSAPSGSLTTLTPEADSTVDEANPTGNFGTSGSLATLANSKTSYLRWNLQGVSGKITQARVRLVPSSVGATAIENYAALAGNGWEESTIQYANQPVANGPMVSWKVQNGQAVEFDVTQEAQEALTADGKLSLQIGSVRSIGSSGTVTYASREGGQPQLILTTTAGNTAPTIASSGDQFVALGAGVESVVLAVADAESAATALVVTASSSNSAFVPNDSAHLTLGGVGGVRSLQITPVPGVTDTATITVTVSDGALSSSTTFVFGVRMPSSVFLGAGSTTWLCPSNVTAVQIECWGAGGAGGSAQRVGGSGTVQFGGGGAGGAYAKVTNYPVVPGNTYYINVGTCASNTNSVTGVSVSGGDSWFNSVNSTNSLPVLAKGGSGGNSAIGNSSTTALGTGGAGSINGSIGNVLYAGGSGASAASGAAGGGGSGAGYGAGGGSAVGSVGGTAPSGGGGGGTGVTNGSVAGGSGFSPGGGGGGARSSSATVFAGGAGGTGQVIVSVKNIAANLTLGGLDQTYDGNPKSVTVTTDPANLNTVVTYNGSTNLPTAGGSYAVVATINENNYSGSVSGTLVIAKISQTITFGLNPVTAKLGDAARTLIATSSSGLPVTLISSNTNAATITGVGGNTLNFVGIGTTTITATQLGNTSYEAATPVAVILTVSPGGTTYANWSGNAAVTSDLVNRYAFGALDKTSAPEKMTSNITPTTLSLTAVVRTDDSKLVITPKSVSSLSGTWSATDPAISVVNAADQAGLRTGLVRKVYSVERGIDSKRFLKLEAVYTP
jgi:hyaluronate lyase